MHKARRCLPIAAVVVGAIVAGAVPAGATGAAKAGLSIKVDRDGLTVTFIARSSGFSSPVDSYHWTFGDGASRTTETDVVTHGYTSASTFSPSVTESDGTGDVATATGTLGLFNCPAGATQFTAALHNVGTVQLLQATGPVGSSSPAGVDLLVAPFRIPDCESSIARAVALADSGFTGDLSVTLEYTTGQPQNVPTTCFSSPSAFVDAAGRTVHNGALPMCQAAGAPCVQSIRIAGSDVTKVLLIPPGDPKVGAP
jgi:hypothetical protein